MTIKLNLGLYIQLIKAYLLIQYLSNIILVNISHPKQITKWRNFNLMSVILMSTQSNPHKILYTHKEYRF